MTDISGIGTLIVIAVFVVTEVRSPRNKKLKRLERVILGFKQ